MSIKLHELSGQTLQDSTGRTIKPSDTVLEVDHFSEACGEQLAQSPLNRRNNLTNHNLADAHYALFSDRVELAEKPSDPDAEKWWVEFFGTPRSRQIRASTQGRARLSETACWSIARELDTYLADLKQRREQEEAEQEQQEEKPLPEPEESTDEGEAVPADGPGEPDPETVAEMAIRSHSIREAMDKVTEKIAEHSSISAGIDDGKGLDPSLFEAMFDRVHRSERLREILDLAGSMMAFRAGKKKEREEGHDMVAGVTNSSDLSRLLPSELACLADPYLELDMLKRLTEEQTLALDKYTEVPSGQGPMVVICDGSGSMDGQPICQAKAFCLTMARIAQEQKRWICFVEFATRGQIREAVFKPEEWLQPASANSLLDWLDHFYSGGGTDFNVLRHVADSWTRLGCPVGKTDVFFITDCQARFEDRLVNYFNDWKKDNDVKCYGLAINSDVGQMPLVCDKYWPTHSMGLESSVVREILSET